MTSRVFACRTVVWLAAAALSYDQAAGPLAWRRVLDTLSAESEQFHSDQAVESGRLRLTAIRDEVEEWLTLYQASDVPLPAFPTAPGQTISSDAKSSR